MIKHKELPCAYYTKVKKVGESCNVYFNKQFQFQLFARPHLARAFHT